MPDWQELVRQRLSGLALDAAERDDVHTELAAHLEEAYDALLKEGVPEQAAAQQALLQVTNWQDLRRKIQIARTMKENIMNDRVRQLWLPGLLTFLLSTSLLALIQIFGLKPWILARDGNLPVAVLYFPWLVVLPLVGAIGTYLSWHAGGTRHAILSSIIFPVLPFLASILLVLPVSLILDHFIAHNIAPMSLLMALLGWVLVPGAALLVGGLPAQLFLSRRLTQRGVASH
jgi:hypothetical protein